MQLNITSRNFKIEYHLEEAINQKLSTLNRYDKHIESIDVVLLKESRAEKIEVKVISKKNIYFSKCFSSSFLKTLSIVYDNILSQIKKKKTK